MIKGCVKVVPNLLTVVNNLAVMQSVRNYEKRLL